jgi:hypothetical protein
MAGLAEKFCSRMSPVARGVLARDIREALLDAEDRETTLGDSCDHRRWWETLASVDREPARTLSVPVFVPGFDSHNEAEGC